MSENKDGKVIEGHDYDGIKESDNDMPAWWLWSFFLCVMFAGIYYLHYTSGAGPTLDAEFKKEWAQHVERFQGLQVATLSNSELKGKFKAGGQLELGAQVYLRTCQVCHGDQLQGGIGANLVDDSWLHGEGQVSQIFDVVTKGVVEKGMPAWGAVLSPDELVAVVGFIWDKRGSKTDNPKAPQGTAYPEYLQR